MNEEQLKEVYRILSDCWKFCKEYSKPVNTSEFWATALQEMKRIVENHENSQFCIDMLTDTLKELERIATSKND